LDYELEDEKELGRWDEVIDVDVAIHVKNLEVEEMMVALSEIVVLIVVMYEMLDTLGKREKEQYSQ
jgi:hypothetical protein